MFKNIIFVSLRNTVSSVVEVTIGDTQDEKLTTLRYEGIWGNGDIFTCILNLGIRWL
jgi:hypothetical protein